MTDAYLVPQWPCPSNVRAYTTLRSGVGYSRPPYAFFNLADHVGDDPEAVLQNRQRLRSLLQLPSEPYWLQQVHGTAVTQAQRATTPPVAADASYSGSKGVVCAVLTADCLPVLFCDVAGRWVAAAHAGWRGLLNGVLEQTVFAAKAPVDQLLVWLGPAIGPQAFEVGEEVRQAFVQQCGEARCAFQSASQCGYSDRPGKWYADLYQLARQRLAKLGVQQVYGGDHCTYHESDRFFSYRRDGISGRMASLIWLADEAMPVWPL